MLKDGLSIETMASYYYEISFNIRFDESESPSLFVSKNIIYAFCNYSALT